MGKTKTTYKNLPTIPLQIVIFNFLKLSLKVAFRNRYKSFLRKAAEISKLCDIKL